MKQHSLCNYDIVAVGQASVDDIINSSYSALDLLGGGAVYVSVITASLGLRSGLVSRIGNEGRERLMQTLRAVGVDTQGVHFEPSASTRIQLYYNGESLEALSIAEGVGAKLSERDIPESYLSTEMLYLGPAPFRTQKRVAQIAKRMKVLVSFGPHADYNCKPLSVVGRMLRNVDVFFANESETLAITGERSLERALRRIYSEGPRIVVATQGKNGSLIYSDEGPLKIPALSPERVVDVVGAGDAFAAGFLVGMHRKLPLRACGLLGSATAACVLGGIGLEVIPNYSLVEQILARNAISLPRW